MENGLNITAGNPLIITTAADLKNVVVAILKEYGYGQTVVAETTEQRASEMPTRLVRKYLQEKGYKVVAVAVLNRLLNEYDIKPRRRGKENWYQVADLERIPARI